MNATMFWEDRKGAGRMFSGSRDEIARRLRTLRCEARVESDIGELIGGCEPADDSQDDKRIKWHWWIEKE